jgi:ubiquinone/menaquinone biosynthesis C-methylase UbiE
MVRFVMKIFFRLLYHSMSWAYDLVAAFVSRGRWEAWGRESTRLLSGRRVLELGYGPGHLQAHLSTSGFDVFGLDESRQMARRASRRMAQAGQVSRLARGTAQHLPFPGQSFDSVVATFPTLFIVDPSTLEEVLRVLKPGGRLVVLMASWITGNSTVERGLRWLFQVTGQAPDEHQDVAAFTAPYLQAGFQAKLRFVNLPGSRLMFIIAAKG